MADVGNLNAPMGFQPVCDANGRKYVGKGNRYYKGTAANTRICKGDRVVAVASHDPLGNREIVKAAANAPCTGVVVGFEVDPTDLHKLCYEATDTGYVMVEDDPNILYRIQEDSVGGALAILTAVGEYIDPIANLDGDQQTGLSLLQLDSSTLGTGTSCRIARLDNSPNNAVGDYAKWLVQMNQSTEINDSASNLTDI